MFHLPVDDIMRSVWALISSSCLVIPSSSLYFARFADVRPSAPWSCCCCHLCLCSQLESCDLSVSMVVERDSPKKIGQQAKFITLLPCFFPLKRVSFEEPPAEVVAYKVRRSNFYHYIYFSTLHCVCKCSKNISILYKKY